MAGIVVRTAMDYTHIRKWGGYRRWIAHLVTERWRGNAPTWIPGETRVVAEIIRANWAAQCPGCRSYILIEPGELYFCPDCLMANQGGQAALVVWPEHQTEIVNALAVRHDPMTRNWLQHETLDDLYRENAEHQEL